MMRQTRSNYYSHKFSVFFGKTFMFWSLLKLLYGIVFLETVCKVFIGLLVFRVGLKSCHCSFHQNKYHLLRMS